MLNFGPMRRILQQSSDYSRIICNNYRLNATKFSFRGGAPRQMHILKSDIRACKQILRRSGLTRSGDLERFMGISQIHITATVFNQGGNNRDEDDRDRMLSALKTAVGFLLVPLFLMFLFSNMGGSGGGSRGMERAQRPNQPIGEISWSDFYHNLLMKGEVQEIIIHAGVNRATAILHPGAVYRGQRINTQVVRIISANVTGIEEKVREAEQSMGIKSGDGIPVNYERNSETAGRIITLLIGLGLLAIIVRGFRNVRMSVGGSNPLQSFSKADFTLVDPRLRQGRGVKFSDVAGLKEPKIEVMEFVDLLKNPQKYVELGAKPPKGVLLLGPPGCGKTMLAKAVANEANVPFLSMNGSEFIEMIGGLGASRVRNLFSEAKKRAPSIIYIDEIDAIGRQRNMSGMGPVDGGEADQTLNQLLVEMDGMTSASNVILLASTNRADILDKALLRPGRFDRHISIDLPTVVERWEIFEKHLSRVVLEEDKANYSERLATLTPGFSGADIANVVNEAALHAARHMQDKITKENLEYAIERVVAGPEKKSGILGPEEKKIVAYHESGHALVGWMLQHTDALLKVTILPRTSHALGFAQYTPVDKKLFSPEELMDRMCMALGGRVAESMIFNRVTTGAEDDLKKVTKMAYAQIREFGFNPIVGHMSFEINNGKKPYSKKLANIIDLEAKKLIFQSYKRTEDCLKANMDKLELLSQKLLEKETLNYQDVEDLLGPPPFGKKHLVSPLDYERQLKEHSELGDKGQGI